MIRSFLCFLTGAVTLSVLALAPAAGQAQEPAQGDAMAVLERMATKLSQAQTIRIKAERRSSVIDPRTGDPALDDADITVLAKRPAMAYSEAESDLIHNQFYFNGSEITLLNKKTSHYSSVPFKGDLDSLLGGLVDRFGFAPPLAIVISPKFPERLKGAVKSAEIVGTEEVAGKTCTHIRVDAERAVWDVFVDEEDLPRRLSSTFKDAKTKGPQISTTIEKIRLGKSISDKRFTFKPGRKDVEIDILEVDEEIIDDPKAEAASIQ